MLNFKKLDLQGLKEIKEYFANKNSLMCDFTLGEKFLWENNYQTLFAIEHETLIMLENYDTQSSCFYYPIGKDIEYAFSLMEEHVTKKGIRLEFCCLNEEETLLIKKRYPHAEIVNNINWNDYLYDANTLMSFSGKHLSGQRNHLNNFIRLYPDYKFHVATSNDISRLHEFMQKLKQTIDFPSVRAEYEFDAADRLIDVMFLLNMHCAYIEINHEIVGITIGEVISSCLFVHIEKAFKGYQGVYQALVYNFANLFKEKIIYINREEDDGDLGLRLSKQQYHPLMMIKKNFAYIRNNIDFLKEIPHIQTERLTLGSLTEESANSYYSLATNDLLNNLWGYNYKDDLNIEDICNGDYFYNVVQKDFVNKDAISFILYLNKSILIGEIVLYEFKNDNSCTIGFRLLEKYQHFGYMQEALRPIFKFLFENLNIKYISCKCYKSNIASKKLIDKMNFVFENEDDNFYYFKILNNR